MIYYRVNYWADGRNVYTSSLGRKVSKHGYMSQLAKGELLTLTQVKKCCLSGKANKSMFTPVNVDKKRIVTHKSDRKYYFG